MEQQPLAIATLSADGIATLTPSLPGGSYTIVASYGGDAVHSPSTSQPISVTQVPATFSLNVAPSTIALETNESANATVTLTSTAMFSDTVTLTCSGLPSGVICQFSSPSLSLAAASTGTAQLTLSAGSTVTTASAERRGRAANQRASLACVFLFPGFFFGCLFARLRRRYRMLRTAMLVLLGGSVLMATGCTTIHLNKTTQAYVIQVTGTGVNSHVVQSQNVTVNISQ